MRAKRLLGLSVLCWLAAATHALGEAWQTAVLEGADVRSLAIAPGDPDLVFAGTSSGQIFVSFDAGDRWSEPGGRIAFPGWIISDLAFDPNTPGRLWAALWGLWGGGLVVRSDDLGRTWDVAAEGLPEEAQVYTLALVPGRPGQLYAGTRRGVYGTKNDGATWEWLTGSRPEMQKVTSLLVDESTPDTVVAGTWRRAYRSRDAGRTWGDVFEGMVLDSEVFTLNPVPGRPGELWASTCGWVYHGVGLGDRWTRHKSGFEERRTPSFHVLDGQRLLAGTVAGVYRSTNAGLNWTRRTREDLAILTIERHPERPDRVLVGTEGSGVWRSNDAGETWSRASRGLTNVRISALAIFGQEIFAAVRYAGPESGLYRSSDGGRTFERVLSPEALIVDLAVFEGRLYAGTEAGLFEQRGGEWRKILEGGSERVQAVSAAMGEVLVRTATRMLHLRGDRFEPVRYRFGAPRAGAYFADSIWLSDGVSLHRIAGDTEHSSNLPHPGGQLASLPDRLVLAGRGGVWSRRWADGPWETMLTAASRVVELDDPRYPLLVASDEDETLRLYDAERGVFTPIGVPVPTSSVAAAAIFADRLLIGTSGYGVISGPLPSVESAAR